MKVVYSVIVLLAALGLALCLPTTNKNEEKTKEKDLNKDVDFVPVGDKNGGFPPGGVIDVDANSFFGDNPFAANPFSSAFNGFEAALTRMRQLLNQFLGRLPGEPNGADFPELHIPNFGNVDLGKGNTTSVTKVINGHKVTINDTEYKSDEANGSSFFKVHIVEVHPDDFEETSTKKDTVDALPPKPDVESVEEAVSNEIPKVKDNEGSHSDENIETYQADANAPQKAFNPQWNKITNFEGIEDNRIDSPPQKIYDLSKDIYVNQLLADSGAKTNPNAEVFESLDGRIPSAQYYPEVRAAPNRVAPYSIYPSNIYEQQMQQQFSNSHFYPPPMVPLNDPYYNRFEPEQIVIVPLVDEQHFYTMPASARASSSVTQGVPPSTKGQPVFSSTSSNTTPDKFPSPPSTT